MWAEGKIGLRRQRRAANVLLTSEEDAGLATWGQPERQRRAANVPTPEQLPISPGFRAAARSSASTTAERLPAAEEATRGAANYSREAVTSETLLTFKQH